VVYEKITESREIIKVYRAPAAPKQLFTDFSNNNGSVIPSIRKYLLVHKYCTYGLQGHDNPKYHKCEYKCSYCQEYHGITEKRKVDFSVMLSVEYFLR